jgi:hypothetical protein
MHPTLGTFLHAAGLALVSVVMLLCSLWGALALWFRISDEKALKALSAASWAAFGAGALLAAWRGHAAAGVLAQALAMAVLLTWWLRLRPTHAAQWADELAQLTTGVVEGNRITIHNVRNFEWRTSADYTPAWETRTYDLDALRSVDMIMSYWRGPAIAHMVVSFGFRDGAQVAFSVEIRRKKNQQFSEIGGFFKEFELGIIAADELDVIRLRTNVRGERVHLYRLQIPPAAKRSLFLGYVGEANALAARPRFYNTITVNCTTLVYQMMQRIVGRLPLSYRLLFSGYMPEYVYRVGGLDNAHSLEELRERGYISERAKQCTRTQDFSRRIRDGICDSR